MDQPEMLWFWRCSLVMLCEGARWSLSWMLAKDLYHCILLGSILWVLIIFFSECNVMLFLRCLWIMESLILVYSMFSEPKSYTVHVNVKEDLVLRNLHMKWMLSTLFCLVVNEKTHKFKGFFGVHFHMLGNTRYWNHFWFTLSLELTVCR